MSGAARPLPRIPFVFELLSSCHDAESPGADAPYLTKDVQMPPITIDMVRFRIDHNHNYQGNEPIMKLIRTKGYVTSGFLRGTNLAVGQIVHAQTADGQDHWTGWITAKGLDDFYSKMYPTKRAWFFVLYAMRKSTGGKPGDPVNVTVTVTDPNDQTQTGSTTADPPPQISDVP
jgi:hypothetical protein